MKGARMWMRLGRHAAALVLGAGLVCQANAEIQRVEAIGVVPLKPSEQGAVDILDQAVQAALHEAVSRVARDFLLEVELGEDQSLEEVLGRRMVPYTARFRILDDQGERPALFAEDPTVTSEYVVEVEVFVDADRVQQRLVEAGLLEPDPVGAPALRIEMELRGLAGYPAYEAVRLLLTEQLGARQVLPRSFQGRIAVLEVELEGDEDDVTYLAEQLLELSSRELQVRPLELAEGRLVVQVDWAPQEERESEPAARDR